MVVILDKSRHLPPSDCEDLYREACARAVWEAVARFGPVQVTLDRRYKKGVQRDRLDQAIQEGLEDLDVVVQTQTQHLDSRTERVLQVADAVAWAIFQKYERDNETFWKAIQGKIAEVRL